MNRMLVLLCCVAGCGLRMVDPCATVDGTCLAIQVEPGSASADLDTLSIDIDGDGIQAHKTVGDKSRFSLPVAVAAQFDSAIPKPIDLGITVVGLLGDAVVGAGAASVAMFQSGQHRTVTVRLDRGSLSDDLSTPPDSGSGCHSDIDCSVGDYCDAQQHCTAFAPSLLPGLVIWLDPDHGLSTDGSGNVMSWTDQSGNNNTARADIMGAPAAIPNGLNSHSVVRFGANATAALRIADQTSLRWGTGPFTVAILQRFTNVGDGALFLKTEFNSPYSGVAVFAGASSYGSAAETSIVAQVRAYKYLAGLSGLNDGTWRIVVFRRGTANDLSLRIDGHTASSGATETVNVDAPGRDVMIGHSSDGPGQQMIGDVAEVLAVQGNLAAEDVARLEAYLRAKYKLPIN